ncbi:MULTISPECIES: hypothetical protein [Parachlamydia]|jgi:hypothetical protein|uniref:hypothetical protein n=1 Tax=Parachlamydia TaxID=83551 RepID=UPI0024E26EBB|nr:hypothetical protein [Parachlamydia acanthamoebae]
MQLSFGQIFEAFDGCAKSTPLKISTKEIKDKPYYSVEISPSSFWTLGTKRRKIHQQNEETLSHFMKLIQNTAHLDAQPKLLEKLQAKYDKGTKLTAGRVRKIYRKCIASHLDGPRQVACLAKKESDRIIFDETSTAYKTQKSCFRAFRKKIKNENRNAISKCYTSFVEEWGKERVDRTLQRYHINMRNLHAKGKPLTAGMINKISLGIADSYAEDLYLTWDRVKQVCLYRAPSEILPLREKRKLAELLGTDSDEALKKMLITLCEDHLTKAYDELPHELHGLFSKATLLNADELELMFQGKRIEGIITGYPPLSSLYFHYPKDVEDRGRLQLYQTIMTLSQRVFNENIPKASDEIYAKALPKLTVSEGMLVPSPSEISDDNGSNWYLIKKRIEPGGSKVALHLSQLHKGGIQLPEILAYRSTTTIPTQQKCIETVLDDSWMGGPGYFPSYRWKGIKEENEVLFSNLDIPLKVLGHSLGGTHAQLFLINRLKKRSKSPDRPALPNRDIHIISFDAPATSVKDATEAGNYLSTNPRIAVNYFFSYEDSIPGAGGAFLGFDMAKEAINKVRCTTLGTANIDHPALKLHPHGRFYYLSPETYYTEMATEVENFSSQAWRAKVELIRKTVSFFLFPPVFVLGYTKRFFVGRTGKPSGIRFIFNKIFGIKPKPKKIKNYGLNLA